MIGSTSVTTIERFIIDQERKYPEATGELSNLLYDIALGAKMIAAAIRRAGLVNILGAMGSVERPGRGAAEARRLRQRDPEERAEPHRARLRHGVGRGRRTDHPDSRPSTPPGSTSCCSTRSTAPPTSTSNACGRDDLQRLPAGVDGRAGDDGRRAAARAPAGGRGVRDVRLEHHAGLHDRPGRARLHARSHDRRVSPLPPRHQDAGGRQVLQRERIQLTRAGTGAARWRSAVSTATRRSGCRARTAATSARSWRTSTAT